MCPCMHPIPRTEPKCVRCCPTAATGQISSATRKCRRPQITQLGLQIPQRALRVANFHRHCRGLPRRMAVYAKAAGAAVLRYAPAVRAIAAHHDSSAGFANCNLNAQMVLFSLLPAAASCTGDGGHRPPKHTDAMVINAQCPWLWCSLNARGEFTQGLYMGPSSSDRTLQCHLHLEPDEQQPHPRPSRKQGGCVLPGLGQWGQLNGLQGGELGRGLLAFTARRGPIECPQPAASQGANRAPSRTGRPLAVFVAAVIEVKYEHCSNFLVPSQYIKISPQTL